MNKTCKTCKYSSMNGLGDIICINSESDYCCDFVKLDFGCQYFEFNIIELTERLFSKFTFIIVPNIYFNESAKSIINAWRPPRKQTKIVCEVDGYEPDKFAIALPYLKDGNYMPLFEYVSMHIAKDIDFYLAAVNEKAH